MPTKQRRLHVDEGPNLKFRGEIVASDEDSYERRNGSGRWTEIELYKTTRGRYVCYRVHHTIWQGESARCEAETVDSHEEVVAFFGYGNSAKSLYDHAGITAHEVDPDTEEA